MQIGQAIRKIRLEQGLVSTDLAILTGVTQSEISQIEKGKRDLRFSTIQKIALGLGVRPSELVQVAEGETDGTPNP